ncbi:acetyl-CoA carboxylase biotin carboxyl carrier protein [Marchantia polymorpha subsp. ruderalis]|nr:hypothetical protein MARPO_0086s0045 [Marchantia polymorpha]BBN11019.1 hypothetical protein Mp_5g08400 [Marchantia polymorpha subsp. ruderalis]|eukprot:PTQ33718.1 hypothetical protein MARPO_0086s0045 [Marchantia polymorpha]
MAYAQAAAGLVGAGAGAAEARKIGAILSSTSGRPGMRLVLSRLATTLSLRSTNALSAPICSVGRSRRAKKLEGFRVINCASPVNQIGLNNVHGVVTSAGGLDADSIADEEERSAEAKILNKTHPSISSFMADVTNLVRLVDSRDIIELEMKHKDYELVIRKKEALPPPPPPPSSIPGPHVMAHTSYPEYLAPPAAPQGPAWADATPAPESASETPQVAPASLYPPMLSPMAGTFYRSPAPGEPAFVQVGDKITKGQVICIVEAMKLMNEIEADQSGTILEIVAEDGKPVSIESPLYIIKP